MKTSFDVIVIGGGHAGAEAAHAAAKMGSQTLLLTLDDQKIATMPCNPSLGGLGKGHIVYEIAALGGLMPQVASKTYLQARMLNTSKGPAVQGLRLQIDKYEYSKEVTKRLRLLENLTIHKAKAKSLQITSVDGVKRVSGVLTDSGELFVAPCVVVTTGTFLNGRIHIGNVNYEGGPYGSESSIDLSASLAEVLQTSLGRLKTGTPPRLLRQSLDFSKLEHQKADALEYLFEFEHMPVEEKKSCFLTHTTEQTHAIIEQNLSLSAMYSGTIKGIGPRYCPSIEDKIGRFKDRTSHHVFVEPESGTCDEVYPAGLSTSLPAQVQERYIRSIPGFENAVITQMGYAIEYDFLQPSHLKHSLEAKALPGLFCAGQINGTTGYEEAAGQGIIAGINAHLAAHGQSPFIMQRTEGYIGVMIDDIITLGVDEPYRMFTSRAERRLILRQDNVFARLMPHGHRLGLVSDELYAKFLAEEELVAMCVDLIAKDRLAGGLFETFHVYEFTPQAQQRAREHLIKVLSEKESDYSALSARALLRIYSEIRYEGYIEKERKEAEKLIKNKLVKIPHDFEFNNVPGLSIELAQKLKRYKPQTLADASLIPGITPAALSLLLFRVTLSEQEKRVA